MISLEGKWVGLREENERSAERGDLVREQMDERGGMCGEKT